MKKIILTSIFSVALLGSIFATDARVTQKLAKMNAKAHFTTEQSAKVQVILESYFTKETQLKAKLKGKELEVALSKINQDSKQKVMSVLNENQKKALLEGHKN